jgi:hypothetical protein
MRKTNSKKTGTEDDKENGEKSAESERAKKEYGKRYIWACHMTKFYS